MRRCSTSSVLRRIASVALILAIPSWLHAGIEELFNESSQKDIVSVAAAITPSTSEQPSQVVITAQIEPAWHIYSLTQPAGGPLPTQIRLRSCEEFRQVGNLRVEPLPDRKIAPNFDNLVIETHQGTVTWYIPIAIAPDTDVENMAIDGFLRVQPCSDDTCHPPKEIPFVARLSPDVVLPAGTPFPCGASRSAKTTSIAEPDEPEALPDAPSEQALANDADTDRVQKLEIVPRNDAEQTSFPAILGIAFLGGLILNLMPCVLPVIGLKILSFFQQAGQSRRRALVLNLWYSLGLIVVFVVLATLAVFLSFGWGQLFSFTGFNITVAAIVFVMSLSLLGVWEIPIPGFFGGSAANGLSEREGVAGAFFKGVLTTILATPCSGPFLASALAWAVGRPPIETYTVFFAVGLGMASPYLLIGAFPGLIRFLPKPGAWMDTFKHMMGFVLLGTVVYLLMLVPWAFIVPTIAFLFGLWAACWWIGRTPLVSHFREMAHTWLWATGFAILAGLFAFGPLADVTASRFERAVSAAQAGADSDFSRHSQDEMPWRPFSRDMLEELIGEQRTVLVDFTADWCMTCKTLEKLVLDTPETRRAVHRGDVIPLRADWTHASPEVTEMLEQLGSKQVPVIAIFPAGNANHPIVLRGGYTQEMLLTALDDAGPSKTAHLSASKTGIHR